MPPTLPRGLRDASPELVIAMLAVVEAYLPNANDGSNERTLTTALLHLARHPASALPPAAPPPEHELRAVLLFHGLDARIWEVAKKQAPPPPPSKKGSGVFAFNADSFFSWSYKVSSVKWFVSHAWPDKSTNKLTMLRFFLCVVNLLGALFVACPLLALYLLAVGIALVSYYFWKAGRLLVRSNIAILTIMLAICIMMLVQGVSFECPPERSFNGTVWRNFEANTPARYAPQPGPLA